MRKRIDLPGGEPQVTDPVKSKTTSFDIVMWIFVGIPLLALVASGLIWLVVLLWTSILSMI